MVEEWFWWHEDSSDAGYATVCAADLGFLVDTLVLWAEAKVPDDAA